jgi:hypothetical protein
MLMGSPLQRAHHEGVHGALADLPRAEDVEGPDAHRREPELLVVAVREVLGGELADGVGPAGLADGAEGGHVALAHAEA